MPSRTENPGSHPVRKGKQTARLIVGRNTSVVNKESQLVSRNKQNLNRSEFVNTNKPKGNTQPIKRNMLVGRNQHNKTLEVDNSLSKNRRRKQRRYPNKYSKDKNRSDRIAVSSKYKQTMEIKNIDPAIVDVKEEIPIIAEFRGDTRILETPNAVFRKLFARLGLIKLHSIDLASTENHLNFQEHRIHAIRRTIGNTQAIDCDRKLYVYLKMNRHSSYKNREEILEHYTLLFHKFLSTYDVNVIDLSVEQANKCRHTIGRAVDDSLDNILTMKTKSRKLNSIGSTIRNFFSPSSRQQNRLLNRISQ